MKGQKRKAAAEAEEKRKAAAEAEEKRKAAVSAYSLKAPCLF